MRKLMWALVAFFTVGTFQAKAAMTGLEVEVVTYHQGIVGNYDLTGYVTYNVYAVFDDQDDFLSAIYNELDLVNDPTIINPSPFELVTPDCSFFKHPIGGLTLGQSNPLLYSTFPALEFTTALTIGQCNMDDPGIITTQPLVPVDIYGSFCASGQLEVLEGILFTLFDGTNPQATAGEDFRVKVAQVTSCGDWCFSANFLTILGGISGETQEQGFSVCNPCTDFLPNSITSTNPTCSGDEDGIILITPNIPEDTDFNLYDINTSITDPVASNTTGLFNNLAPSIYFVEMQSVEGCLDSTEVITLTDPDLLVLDVTLLQDNLCFEECIAELGAEISGGTGTNAYLGLDTNNDGIPDLLPGDEICGGEYVAIAADELGCIATDTITVTLIEEFTVTLQAVDVACFGECTGVLTSNISGGVGELSFLWEFCDGSVSTNEFAAELCACGTYTLTVTDSNGCTAQATYDMESPEEILLDVQTTPISCASECDATLVLTPSGGTGELTVTIDPVIEDLNAVCPGMYSVTVTDESGCELVTEVEIEDPSPIEFSIDITDIACGGLLEGGITVVATGGNGNVDVLIDPASPGVEASEHVWTGLAAGDYTITIFDDNCAIVVDTLIFEPQELLIDSILIQDVQCFGLNNGSALVQGNAGGSGPYTYTLSATNQPSDSLFTDLGPGLFPVTITDANGCFATTEIEILEPSLLEVVLTDPQDLNCGGECSGEATPIVTGGSEPYLSIIWNEDPLQIDTELCAGTNTLIVVDANSCQSQASVEISEPEPIGFVYDVDNATCTNMDDGSAQVLLTGGTGPLDLEGPIVEVEDLEDSIFEINNLAEGFYILIATDSLGCVVQDTLFMESDILSDLRIDTFTSPVTCWEEDDGTVTVGIVGGVEPFEIQWDDPASQQTATAIGLIEGLYNVVVADALGCTFTAFIEVVPNEECIVITNALTPNNDGANDVWVVGGLEYYPQSKVEVFNRWGQVIFESDDGYPVPWDGTLNGAKLPTADYYYSISLDPSTEPIVGTVTLKY